MSIEPKPCPVCGDVAVIRKDSFEWQVCCFRDLTCKTSGPICNRKEKAITAWNALHYFPDGLPQVPECLGCDGLFKTASSGKAIWRCYKMDNAWYGDISAPSGPLPINAPTWCPKRPAPKVKPPVKIGQEWS